MKNPNSKKTRREKQRLSAKQWAHATQQRHTSEISRLHRRLLTAAATLLVLLIGVLTASCTGIGHATKPETVCAAFKPIYVSKSDSLTPETASEILTHNLTGATLCGWKPHSR